MIVENTTAKPTNANSPSFWDRLITSIAYPEWQEDEKRWKENEKNLEAGRQRLLGGGNLTAENIAKLQRADYSTKSIAVGNAQVFGSEYAATVQNVSKGVFNFAGGLIPKWLWVLLILGLGVFALSKIAVISQAIKK